MAAPDEFTLLCERCGYEIENLPTEGDCPECGKPIAESLPERRPGTPWQHTQTWRALLRTGWTTVRSPLLTLDTMQANEEIGVNQSNRLTILAGAIASVPVMLAITLAEPLIGPFVAPVVLLVVTSFVAPFLSLLTYIEVRGIQFFAARRGGRLTTAMAWSICGHGSAGWVLAASGTSIGASVAVLAVSAIVRGEFTPTLNTLVSVGSTLALLGFLAGFLFFETFAWLGVRRCKFANRARPDEPEQITATASEDQTQPDPAS